MAAGPVLIADLIIPEIFLPYVQQYTEEKSRLIQSGVVSNDEFLSNFLAGGGLTIHAPSFKDVPNDEENVSSDQGSDATPQKITATQEIAVRLSRNQSWSTADLAAALAGADPATSIANRVGDYWIRRSQTAFVSTIKGVYADNAAAPTGADTHTQNDMTFNVSGASFSDGVTNFSAEAFIDATLTMGDSMESLCVVFLDSIFYGRMQKNNLIDFIPDSTGQIKIPTFLGREVIVDDGVPFSGGVFETWLFGMGAVRFGRGSPKKPVETYRLPLANNGGGEESLTNRVEWCFHPAGHAYIGTAPNGGPSNAATTNNLADAASWRRIWTERKQVKMARLITREF
jgi:hypothetical protein